MNEILFEVLKAVLVLATILLTRYTVPYLKESAESKKLSWVVEWAKYAVYAVEQTVLGEKTGQEKKAIAIEFIKGMLIKKNMPISDEQINTLIESAVFAMKNEV